MGTFSHHVSSALPLVQLYYIVREIPLHLQPLMILPQTPSEDWLTESPLSKMLDSKWLDNASVSASLQYTSSIYLCLLSLSKSSVMLS